MKSKLIAPCGMNCAICLGYLRDKNTCPGCRLIDPKQAKTRLKCRIKNCKKLKKYCYSCKIFPCARMKHLDKRYRTKYGMSMIDNLEYIKKNGVKKFIKKEEKRWVRKNGVICVHNKKIYKLNCVK